MGSSLMTAPMELKVLSYNCWGLKYLATYRAERLSHIGTEIASINPPPNIVALQECWTQQDFNAIRQQTQHILPYGKFYFSGIFGGGLAILSKWPIEDSSMVRYPLNGRPTAFFRGDWFVGKGIACAKIRIGEGEERGRIVSVFCTHVCSQ
jgi:sphingomyelin phosphodiesterase 2